MDFRALHQRAHEAGIAAAMRARPAPMHVTDGSRVYLDEGARAGVNAGACGFAWVNIRPGTSAFARWAKSQTMAEWGRPDMRLADKAYRGGVEIWVGQQIPNSIDRFGQSIDIKYAYASGYASVLREAGIEAHAGSRLD